MSTGGPWTKNMWFSSLRLLASEAGRTLVNACKDWERMKKDHQIIPIEVQPFFGWFGWPGVGSCPARDLHCGAQLLQERRLSRRFHGCCHRAGVVLQVFDPASPERCKVQVLTEALDTNSHVTHLNLEKCLIYAEGIQVGEPGMGSGFRRRSSGSLHKTRQVRRILPTFLIYSSIYSSAVARSMLDSGANLQSKDYLNTCSFEDQ